MKYAASFFFALALLLVATGCRNKKPVIAQTPQAPEKQQMAAPTATLSVNPESVQKGQSAELTWSTANASSVTIDGVGTVSASGSKTITPAESTTYHLTATNDGGSADASARLTVTPGNKEITVSDEELFRRSVKDIFFNYDNADIRGDEQTAISADAQFLAAHPAMQLVLEGHCDERGSEDYNMALGQNRAEQVKEALVKQGVSADRIKLISLGKEKPFCSEANESCWSQNRRAHFVLANKQQASAE
jgi:peptidoglycan-associated lipoprotein